MEWGPHLGFVGRLLDAKPISNFKYQLAKAGPPDPAEAGPSLGQLGPRAVPKPPRAEDKKNEDKKKRK